MTSTQPMARPEATGPRAIEEIILDFIRTEIGGDEVEDLDLDENLLTSGLVDSVAIVRLIGHLEDVLGVTVPPPDMVPANFRTVRVMAGYLRGLQA